MVSKTLEQIAERISKIEPPSVPLRIEVSAARCCMDVAESITGWRVPLPSCTAPGNHIIAANLTASSFTSPYWPLSIRHVSQPSQYPRVGRALNWQGHPQAQLQVTTSSPVMYQSVFTAALIGDLHS